MFVKNVKLFCGKTTPDTNYYCKCLYMSSNVSGEDLKVVMSQKVWAPLLQSVRMSYNTLENNKHKAVDFLTEARELHPSKPLMKLPEQSELFPHNLWTSVK